MLDVVKNGATYKPADVSPGALYWKLIIADGPEWWEGKHSIFVDCWDTNGLRVVGVPVTYSWPGDIQTKLTELKKGEPYALDFPMFNSRPALGIWVSDNRYPSDALHGLGLVPFERHVSYKLVFQLTRAEAAPQIVTPPAPTPPGNKSKVRLYIDDVLVYEQR